MSKGKGRIRASGKSERKKAFWRADPKYRSARKPSSSKPSRKALDNSQMLFMLAEPRASAEREGDQDQFWEWAEQALNFNRRYRQDME